MTDGKESKRNLPLLNSSNWDFWKKVIYGELLSRGNLWNIVAGNEVPPVLHQIPTDAQQQSFNKFQERKTKALGILLTNCGPEMLSYLPEFPDDPVQVWNTLKERCQPNTVTSFYALRAELNQMHLKEDENVVEWLRKGKQIYNRLAGLNHAVDESTQCIETLSLLPPSFAMFRQSLMVMLGAQGLNFAQLTDQLRTYLTTNSMQSAGNPDETAHFAYGQRSRGRGRGFTNRRGGRGGNSRSSSNNTDGNTGYNNSNRVKSFRRKCYGCGGYGHIKSECPSVRNQASRENNSDKSGEHSGHLVAEKEGCDNHLFNVAPGSHMGKCLLDSGATCHITPDRQSLTDAVSLDKHESVCLADGNIVYVTHYGILKVQMNKNGSPGATCDFQRCLYVPDLSTTLISVSAIDKAGHFVTFGKGKAEITTSAGAFVGLANKVSNSYQLDCQLLKSNIKECASIAKQGKNSQELWHRRYGHLGERNLNLLYKGELVRGMKRSPGKLALCEPCVEGKTTEEPYPPKSEHKSTNKLELVHSNVCGPFETPTNSGNRYYVTFTDDCSPYVWVYLLKFKSQVFDVFKIWLTVVEKETGCKLMTFRSDNGGEYISSEFSAYLNERGISHQFSAPYSPQQNGVAERLNRTLSDKYRSMLLDAGLNDSFWGEAVVTAAYLLNRSPSSCLESKTPYEAWKGSKPQVCYLRVFGCVAYAMIPSQWHRKLGKKTEMCIFLGYATMSKAYRLWSLERNKVLVRRTVIFDEDGIAPKQFESKDDSKHWFRRTGTKFRTPTDDCSESDTDTENGGVVLVPQFRRTQRQNAGQPPQRYQAGMAFGTSMSPAEDGPTRTYKQAMESAEADKWKKAIDAEYNSLVENGTWELVDRPADRKIIGGKWVFKLKKDEFGNIARYKARFVAQGYSQTFGQDYHDTFSPVVRWESVRILLSVAVQLGMKIHQIDIETAFLNGELQEEVFLKQPEGYIKKGDENKVCKLIKSIYGLKQSPRAWNCVLYDQLLTMQFKQSSGDPCIYTGNVNGNLVYIAVYVDYIIIISKEESTIAKTKKLLGNRFKNKDLGQLHHFLGVRVQQTDGSLWLNQSKHITDILERAEMQDAKPISTPMEPGISMLKAQDDEFVSIRRCINLSLVVYYILLE